MRVLIIDNGTKHLGRLKDLLFGNEIITMPYLSKYENLSFDLIILTGGSHLSIKSAPEIYNEEIKLIKNTKIPIIGICIGCELIAKAFGSELIYIEKRAKGLKKNEVIKNDNIFAEETSFDGYESHHYAISKLGKDIIGLARSKYGYEVIKHNKRSIYGLQFHPEMLTDESLGDDIFRRIVNKITT